MVRTTSIRPNGIIINEPESIGSAFDNYFNNIPSALSKNISNNAFPLESYLNDQIPESENFTQTSMLEITNVINKLKNSNSVGWDNIPSNTIKDVNILAPILLN